MISVYFIQAECGDAAYLAFLGNDDKYHYVFIDSGFERTYNRFLAEAIETVDQIDLFVVSHIHDDHIGGVIGYIKSIERNETTDKVIQWCYNPPRHKIPSNGVPLTISAASSIDQGDQLLDYLAKVNKLPKQEISNVVEAKNLYGLNIYWLSPSPVELERMRDKYANPAVKLEKEEQMEISLATATGNDYYITVEAFDLMNWKQDTNLENASSIAFLTELNGFKILWLADADPRVVQKAIEDLGFTPDHRLKCDFVKVSHHGSKGNNSDDLYSLIECQKYIISADGENRHYLPSKESIVRILRNQYRDVKKEHYEFYLTYDNLTLRSIFDVDGETVFEKWNFSMNFNKDNCIRISQVGIS